MQLSKPHGGTLINRVLQGSERQAAVERAKELRRVDVDDVAASDIELIATGVVSPLTGFMNKEDYESVLKKMRLANGVIWSIPLTLPVSTEEAETISVGDELALYAGGELRAVMTVSEKYSYDKKYEAEMVYGTTEEAHPGVARVYRQGEVYLAGDIWMVNPPSQAFPEHYYTPAETREKFAELGWKTVVGFQTRNPIHRAHEYIQKCALEIVDGLFVHPLVGETKSDDIPADIRMKSYTVLLDKYYPHDRTLLGVFPAAMRYAGPREAIFHAMCRKNYGCTHFIVGRDHAGVGSYYGTYDAQKIFEQFDAQELGITTLNFEHAFYCTRTQGMATAKTSPGSPEERIFLSGTRVREMLTQGEVPPVEFTRPEVAEVLMEGYRRRQQEAAAEAV